MADFDYLSDAKGLIINYITDQLKDLFYRKSNPYNIAAWAQSILLLVDCVIPCDYYVPEELLILAKKILDKAKKNNYSIKMCQLKDGKEVNVYHYDYSKEKDMIKKWVQDIRGRNSYY
ncbi:MAG: hypothetical protein ACFFAO_10620 [Candidatus Hermodarchaeota archaeon]